MTRHLLVIGGQRCGTTALYELLDAHPDITMNRPARPEPKVFCSAELAGRGIEWYLSTYFTHARDESLLGDKSTSYLEDPEAPARACAVLGHDAAIVVQLRDPVARAVSNWLFSSANGLERRPLAQALEDNLRGERDWNSAASSVSPYAYLERGRYADLLAPWCATFPHTVHVRFADLDGGPDIAELYAALEVDPSFEPPRPSRRVNVSGQAPPVLTNDLADRMRAYYRDTDRRLVELVGRALPWPTGRSDTGA